MGSLLIICVTGLLQTGSPQGDLAWTCIATSISPDGSASTLVSPGPVLDDPRDDPAPFVKGNQAEATTSCVTETARPKWRMLVAVVQAEVRLAGRGASYAAASFRPTDDSWDASHDVLRV